MVRNVLGVIWAQAAMNRFVKELRGCFAMEEKQLSQQREKGKGGEGSPAVPIPRPMDELWKG